MTAKEVSMELNVPVRTIWGYVCNSDDINHRPNELDFNDFRVIQNHFSRVRNGVMVDYRHSYNCA